MAEKILDPTSIEARMKYGKPEDAQTIEPERKGLMARAGAKAQQLLEDAGISRAAARKAGTATELIGESAPLAGDVNDIREMRAAAEEGDVAGMALSGVAFIPFVGNILKRGIEPSMEVFRGADDIVKERALRMTSTELGRIPNPDKPDDVRFLVENAAYVEKRLAIEQGVPSRPDAPRAEDRADWLTRDRDNPEMYHGVQVDDKYAPEKIESEGLTPTLHNRLDEETVSLTRDPLYAGNYFGGGDEKRLFQVDLTDEERAALDNMRPSDYEAFASEGGLRDSYLGQLEEMPSGVSMPKSGEWINEAETAMFGIDRASISRLSKVNPEKAAFLQEGMNNAQDVMEELAGQEGIITTLAELGEFGGELSPAEAKEIYNRIRDNMKKALGLAKYTSDNSARGSYDWYVDHFSSGQLIGYDDMQLDKLNRGLDAGPAILPVEKVDVDMMKEGLEVVRDSLVGEQNQAMLDRLLASMDIYGEGRNLPAGAFAENMRRAKKYDSVRDVMADRKKEIEELKSQNLSEDQFTAAMKQLTEKYKPAMQQARAEDKEMPLGFINVAEKMAVGGLVTKQQT